MTTTLLCYIVFLPLLGFLVNGVLSFLGRDLAAYTAKRFGWSPSVYLQKTSLLSSWIGCGVIFLSFVSGVICCIKLARLEAPSKMLTQNLFLWFESGSLQLHFSLQLDALSAVMVLVVTGVGALIHLYSVGYMQGDRGFSRYFAYLNFFIFAMLLLVLGNNLPVLFIGWEGVGLASYLLIGFWFTDSEKARAGKKAFLVNRIGDLGFMLGILLLFVLLTNLDLKTVDLSFSQIQENISKIDGAALTAVALLLFWGACGKSAQIPLYVWLPDAMAGPTPVSALIHAATMVTAGVYMVVRLTPLYFASPIALTVVATVGALTALFAATIALVQNDIKKVLAYSTISQLGYMFLACGVGAPLAAMFHLVTHAFFKACLFLGAGSVIHGLHGEQDAQKMGGLRKSLPSTFWTFLVASSALAGIPLFSGFFSKDQILHHTWTSHIAGNQVLWVMAVLASLCTSFYIFRLVYLVFLGESRFEHGAHEIHKTPRSMSLVLIVLGILSVVGGILGIAVGNENTPLEQTLGKIVPFESSPIHFNWQLALYVSIAFLGLMLAALLYRKGTQAAATEKGFFHKVLWNKYFVDELYQKIILRPLFYFADTFLSQNVDKKGIDGVVRGLSQGSNSLARQMSQSQSGDVQIYLFYMLLGLAAMAAAIFFGV